MGTENHTHKHTHTRTHTHTNTHALRVPKLPLGTSDSKQRSRYANVDLFFQTHPMPSHHALLLLARVGSLHIHEVNRAVG